MLLIIHGSKRPEVYETRKLSNQIVYFERFGGNYRTINNAFDVNTWKPYMKKFVFICISTIKIDTRFSKIHYNIKKYNVIIF